MNKMIVAVGAFVLVNAAVAGPLNLENWTSCGTYACIDTAPQGSGGLDGSAGWGWGGKGPVTELKVGVPASFTVTVMQPNDGSPLPLCGSSGSITLTYSSQDFSLNPVDSRGVSGTNPFDRGGVAVFAYDGNFWCHVDQSVAYTFTPLNATKDAAALVTATVTTDGQRQASGTFPVTIKK